MSSAETQQSAQDGRVNAETAVRAQAEWRRALNAITPAGMVWPARKATEIETLIEATAAIGAALRLERDSAMVEVWARMRLERDQAFVERDEVKRQLHALIVKRGDPGGPLPLEHIERYVEEATPGPWEVVEPGCPIDEGKTVVATLGEGDGAVRIAAKGRVKFDERFNGSKIEPWGSPADDAKLIVAMREYGAPLVRAAWKSPEVAWAAFDAERAKVASLHEAYTIQMAWWNDWAKKHEAKSKSEETES